MTSYTPNFSLPYPSLTDPPNAPAQLSALAIATDNALGNGLAASTSYAGTWINNVGSNPSIGNGAISYQYFKLGHMVTMTVSLQGGSTTTWGSTTPYPTFWKFNCPFPAKQNGGGYYAGSGMALISAGATNIVTLGALLSVNSGTPFVYLLVADTTTTGQWDQMGADAYAWTTGSIISFTITYESTT